ncbi:sensor histidine kinase [Mucilaginibacter pedocola]|uniref:histidine kinase n=1 Tax=Mucilaginibacter pedocola TaxID=1792845 RepID=A0A1S9P758_9SPHI|nr:sensor histidine kinase [Mucilaginibacter pedocola]OOQ56785.1 hypothetical protein BC343_17520 [Mucilaginibacter pedocola]
MKKRYLILILLLLPIALFAQNTPAEDLPLPVLKKQLAEAKTDTAKLCLQIGLGRAMLQQPNTTQKTIDSAIVIAAQAEKQSRKLAYPEGLINALLLAALSQNRQGAADAGLKMAQQALAYAQKMNNPIGIADAYTIIGQHYPITDPDGLHKRIAYYNKATAIFRKAGNLYRLENALQGEAELLLLDRQQTNAIKLLLESLNINKAIGNKSVQGVYWLIGRTLNEIGDLPGALKYNLLAIKAATDAKDTTLTFCSINYSTAATFVSMKDFKGALPYVTKALQVAKRYNDMSYVNTTCFMAAYVYARTNKITEAAALLEEMKKYAVDDHNRLMVMSSFLDSYVYGKQFTKAAFYAQEVKKLLAKIPEDSYNNAMTAYNFLTSYYVETGQIKEAYFYADKYAKIVYAIKYPIGIRSIENYYYRLDSLRGDFKSALGHYLASRRIRDSIDNVAKAYQVSMLQIENETDQKNTDIQALKEQSVNKDNQLKRNRLIQKATIGGIVLLLVITALIYSRYRLKMRSNALLMKQKAEIDQQNVDLQKLVRDKVQLIDDKDGLLYEKDLLLREVNHRVKNNLQIVMSLLESQSGYTQNETAQEAILESQNRVQSIALIHNQLYNNDKVAEIELLPYITELVDSLDNSLNKHAADIAIRCRVEDILLDVSQAIPLGIILNEAVTNALKYAFPNHGSGQILVSVTRSGDNIDMQISDNGIGLPAGFSPVNSNSLGLTLIKGLTAQLKGTFAMEGENGVTIAISFKIEHSALTGKTAESVAEAELA